MAYLIAAILSMTAIMLTLKVFAVKGINSSAAILINYLIAAIVSLAVAWPQFDVEVILHGGWLTKGIILGLLFFTSMNLYAVSTGRCGVAITTIASRMALIIPILFACWFLGEGVTGIQTIGVALAVIALIVIFYQRSDGNRANRNVILLPVAVFLVTGAMNTLTKYSQHTIAHAGEYALFECIVFLSALVLAALYYAIRQGRSAFRFDYRSIIGGCCLGGFNFAVTYATLHALRHMNTSTFYPTYYIGVIILTALVGIVLFGEKLSARRIVGMAMAAVAIALLYI